MYFSGKKDFSVSIMRKPINNNIFSMKAFFFQILTFQSSLIFKMLELLKVIFFESIYLFSVIKILILFKRRKKDAISEYKICVICVCVLFNIGR